MTFAAWMNRVLRYLLPRLEMRPRMDRPPVLPYHGLPANHSTRLEGRVNDRQSGKDCTTVGRTQGGGAVQSRIGAIAGDISPDATNSLRGPDPAHRFRLVVCRRRWRHRVPHRFPRNGTSARCLANPGQSASIYATRRGGRRLSQSSGQETKETTRRVGTTPALLLLTYTIGAALPMLAVAYGGQAISTRLRRVAPYTARLQQAFGIIVIAFALSAFLQYDAVALGWLGQFFPEGRLGL